MTMSAIILLAILSRLDPGAMARDIANPIDVAVYGNRSLDKDTIINISGIDQDPGLPATEVKKRLETTNLFSRVRVEKASNSMTIVVREKGTWFLLPYFSSDSERKIYGVAAGKSSVWGENGNFLARYQAGAGDHEGSILLRDEFFLNSLWALGASFDYEDALHFIFRERQVVQSTTNEYHGGSIQAGFHASPYISIGLNHYIERHRFEHPEDGRYSTGPQLSHRLILDYSNYYVREGLAQGRALRIYFEAANPASSFHFLKSGISSQIGLFLKGDFNWIMRPKVEIGASLPYYQKFELGGWKLRSFPSQQFRSDSYASIQNDLLLASAEIWKLILRPIAYGDWAFIEGSGRTGLGGGLQVYLKDVAVPALQFFAGYGFNPSGFSITASVGPQL